MESRKSGKSPPKKKDPENFENPKKLESRKFRNPQEKMESRKNRKFRIRKIQKILKKYSRKFLENAKENRIECREFRKPNQNS